MVMPMGRGKPPMGGGMGKMGGGMGMEDDLFGSSSPKPAGEVGDEDIDAMFGDNEMEPNSQDKLFEGLSMAGYNPTPEQMQQILDILEGGGGMAPKGITPTETGMETAPVM